MIDDQSKDLAIRFLTKHGYSCTPTSNQFARSDIRAARNKDGYRLWVEVKERNIPHNRFNDAIMEASKLADYHNQKQNGQVDGGLLINIFADKVITASNIESKHRIIIRNAQHTTCFNNRQMVTKQFVSYEQQYLRDWGKLGL